MNWTASEMGKKGGASTSPDKVRAAKENAKKGGCPIKQETVEKAIRLLQRVHDAGITVEQMADSFVTLTDKESKEEAVQKLASFLKDLMEK